MLCLALSINSNAQNSAAVPRILYGACTTDSLRKMPFSDWFTPGYENYHPDSIITDRLKKMKTDQLHIRVFFGSWCGDSKRELPRFLKLLSSISFPSGQLELIGVGTSDSLIKQSPAHEEAGLGVFRVPVFIVYQNGKEINRINEFPVYSLEKDLLTIFNRQSYTPNYRSFALVQQWLQEGTLLNDNNSIRGLAEQLRPLLSTEYELNSLGYLLLKQAKKKEALQLFRINYLVYPESTNTASSLGEGWLENGNIPQAVIMLEHSLTGNKDPEAIREILGLLYKAKKEK